MTPELLSDPNALVGFGAGAAAGYMFATVTTQRAVKSLNDKLMADRDRRIADLEAEVQDLRQRVFSEK